MLKQYMTRMLWAWKEFVNLPEKRGGEDIWRSARQPVQPCVVLSSVLLCSWKTMQGDSMPGDHPDSWAAYFYMFRSWTLWRSDKDFCSQFTIILWSFECFCCSHLAVFKTEWELELTVKLPHYWLMTCQSVISISLVIRTSYLNHSNKWLSP